MYLLVDGLAKGSRHHGRWRNLRSRAGRPGNRLRLVDLVHSLDNSTLVAGCGRQVPQGPNVLAQGLVRVDIILDEPS